jgi:hypothetical protein
MKRLVFQGYSDDTFACEGPDIDVDLDTCASGRPVTMIVKAGDESLIVVGWYAPSHCNGWLIGIAPHNPGHVEKHLPEWPIIITRSDREYSPLLMIDAPDDVQVELLR